MSLQPNEVEAIPADLGIGILPLNALATQNINRRNTEELHQPPETSPTELLKKANTQLISDRSETYNYGTAKTQSNKIEEIVDYD